MKRLGMLLALVALAGCGGFKNTDPLSGLAGATDTALYNFESSAQGWACSASQNGSCNSVSQAQGLNFAGQGSLQVLLNALSNHETNSACPGGITYGRASIVLGSPIDLTGRTLHAWVYIPQEASAGKDTPTQATIFLKESSGPYGNGVGMNLVAGTWTEVTFSPISNPNGGVVYAPLGGIYLDGSFSPSDILEIGVKISPSGTAPCSFSYTGYVLIDSVSY